MAALGGVRFYRPVGYQALTGGKSFPQITPQTRMTANGCVVRWLRNEVQQLKQLARSRTPLHVVGSVSADIPFVSVTIARATVVAA